MNQDGLPDPQTFVAARAKALGVPPDNLVARYLDRKTKAANRGAKARRSLGNLYALLVLAEDFLESRSSGSRFTDLLTRMRALPFGTKLQNHPLDNRLNDEFARQMGVGGELLPVQFTTLNGQKARKISSVLLGHGGADPNSVAQLIVGVVKDYIRLLTEKQSSYLDEIQSIETSAELAEFLDRAFKPNADARLFEIVSYVLLAEHYRGKTIWIGDNKDHGKEVPLRLFRTGRTNANDGGIDFVLKPLGRFYQVTEVLDFRKYFLDFEKVNRYPISFVVKTELSTANALTTIRSDAVASGVYSRLEVEEYMKLFEAVFTLPKLRQLLGALPDSESARVRIKSELSLQFRLEYGLLD